MPPLLRGRNSICSGGRSFLRGREEIRFAMVSRVLSHVGMMPRPRRVGKVGAGVTHATHCPARAHGPNRSLSVLFTIREGIWGGWTYDKCGCKVDRISAEFLQILFLGPPFLSRLRSCLLDQKLLELLSFLNCNFQPPGRCAKSCPSFTIWHVRYFGEQLLPLQALPRPPRVIFPRPSAAIELPSASNCFSIFARCE